MSVTEELIAANAGYASGFTKGDLPLPPARKVAIVTCMDARLIPSRALGLEEGDAHVIRNAGGLAQDALRSLVISQQLLGTREIVVIHHTELRHAHLHQRATARRRCGRNWEPTPRRSTSCPSPTSSRAWSTTSLFLRESPLLIEGVSVRGFVYDVQTGRLSEVTVPSAATVA